MFLSTYMPLLVYTGSNNKDFNTHDIRFWNGRITFNFQNP